MKPLLDRIVVEILKPEEKKGSIILTGQEQTANKGKVLFIGVKTQFIKVGDTVQYKPNSGTKISYEDKDCLFLSEEHEVVSVL